MRNNAKPFLRNALIITAATILVAVLMNDWGVAQVMIIILLALISAGQWALFLYMKKK